MNTHYPFELPALPYAYNALEPYIDEETMHYHHDKHFKTYIDNLNKFLAPYPQYHDWTLEKLLTNLDSLPKELQTPVRNNAGGVYNHNLYFNSMSGEGNNIPTGSMADAIDKKFGSYDQFKAKMKEAGLGQFGSGWAFLTADSNQGIDIEKTPNQNVPLTDQKWPLLPMDVWEHAYYLKYKNQRDQYVDNWFHVIDWNKVNERVNWQLKA